MSATILPATWRQLLEPDSQSLIAELQELGNRSLEPSIMARLKAAHGVDLLDAAIELSRARTKARAKFQAADRLLCDLQGVEQASGTVAAQWKAKRYQSLGAERIIDLCSGIGGDAMALAEICQDVLAVDRSEARALMTSHNAGVQVSSVDVRDIDCSGAWIHADPSRRIEGRGRRLWHYEDYEPPPNVLEPMLAKARGAAVKLGPGIDTEELPDLDAREIEFLGSRSGMLQAVMWCGELARAPGQNTATRLGDGLSFTDWPVLEMSVAWKPGRYLFVPDPALERARLVVPRVDGRDMLDLAPGLGVLTGDELYGDPWFEEFEIIEEMAWREKKIKAFMKANDGGMVTVRTRASAVSTDREQLALRGNGKTAYILFGLRLGKRITCFACRPVAAAKPQSL